MINDIATHMGSTIPESLGFDIWRDANVAPSQLADRELFDFENLQLKRDEHIRVFEGKTSKAGQIDEQLQQQKGVPIAPSVQTFDPEKPNLKNPTRLQNPTPAKTL